MANRIESLPLTAYDVMGYFIPGLIIVLSSLVFLHGSGALDVKISPEDGVKIYHLVAFVMIVIFSYVSGHVIALLSAVGVERIVIYVYGYPSEFLFSSYGGCEAVTWKRVPKNLWKNISSGGLLRGVCIFSVVIALIPQIISMFLLDVIGIGGAVNKSVPTAICSLFFEKFKKIFGMDATSLRSEEWFFVAQQHLILHSQHAALRMYNYLNLYGFCRNMTFVCSVCGYGLIYLWVIHSKSQHYLPASLIFFLFSVFLLFGFVKFYRRYSHEVVMSICVAGVDEKAT